MYAMSHVLFPECAYPAPHRPGDAAPAPGTGAARRDERVRV